MLRPQYGYATVPDRGAISVAQVEAIMRNNLLGAGFSHVTIKVEHVDDLLFYVAEDTPLGEDQVPIISGYYVYAEGEPPW